MTEPLQRLSNPAGRLHYVLDRALKLKNPQDATTARRRWAEILETPTDDVPSLLRRLGLVFELPDLVEAAIRGIPKVNVERLLVWKPNVAKAFASIEIRSDTKFSHFAQHLDKVTVAFVAVCDEFIANNAPDQRIDLSALEQLLEQIKQLSDEVQGDSDLDDRLRGFILRHLFIIEQAIIDYRFQGLDALTRGLEQVIGASIVNEEVFKAAAQHPTYGERVMKVLGTYAIVVTSVVQTLQLPGLIQKHLPEPPAEVQRAEAVASYRERTERGLAACNAFDLPSQGGR